MMCGKVLRYLCTFLGGGDNRLIGKNTGVHSQNDSGDLRDVTRVNGKLGCLCGKAGTSHVCDGSAHSSGCMANGLR